MKERIERTLAFAAAAVRNARGGGAAWSEEIGNGLTVADKVPVEAAILLMLAARAGVVDAPLAELLAAEIRSDRARAAMARRPQTASLFGVGHVSLTRAGFGDADFDALLRATFDDGLVDAAEKLPYHWLETEWVRAHLFGETMRRAAGSILYTRAHPIVMTKRHAYAVTHALMYATDFGESVDDVPEHAGDLVDACIAAHIVTGDLDILAELLLSAAMLGRAHTPYARCAWKVLDGVWSELGFLPSPSHRTSEFESLEYAFRHTYHTTLMGGDVCALLLRHPPHGEARPAAKVLWKQIRRRLDARGLSVETLDYLKGLPIDDVAAPMLDALLIHACRNDDVDGAEELLAFCESIGHRSTTADAAAAFIRRMASARSPAR